MIIINKFDILYERVTIDYIKLKKIIGKLHKSSSSVAFIEKALFNNLVPTFAKVRGQFINSKIKINTEQKIMKEHMDKHYKDIGDLKIAYNKLATNIQLKVGNIFFEYYNYIIRKIFT